MQVASGSAGSVWRASYRGTKVAAKQLKAMSDLVGLDEALEELTNEVRFLLLLGVNTREPDALLKHIVFVAGHDLRAAQPSQRCQNARSLSNKRRRRASGVYCSRMV